MKSEYVFLEKGTQWHIMGIGSQTYCGLVVSWFGNGPGGRVRLACATKTPPRSVCNSCRRKLTVLEGRERL
jgi:hypothetical protein